MFVLLAMRPVGFDLRSGLEMNRVSISTDAGVERFVAEVEFEAEAPAIVLDRALEVVHQELRRDADQRGGTRCRHGFHGPGPPGSGYSDRQRLGIPGAFSRAEITCFVCVARPPYRDIRVRSQRICPR